MAEQEGRWGLCACTRLPPSAPLHRHAPSGWFGGFIWQLHVVGGGAAPQEHSGVAGQPHHAGGPAGPPDSPQGCGAVRGCWDPQLHHGAGLCLATAAPLFLSCKTQHDTCGDVAQGPCRGPLSGARVSPRCHAVPAALLPAQALGSVCGVAVQVSQLPSWCAAGHSTGGSAMSEPWGDGEGVLCLPAKPVAWRVPAPTCLPA